MTVEKTSASVAVGLLAAALWTTAATGQPIMIPCKNPVNPGCTTVGSTIMCTEPLPNCCPIVSVMATGTMAMCGYDTMGLDFTGSAMVGATSATCMWTVQFPPTQYPGTYSFTQCTHTWTGADGLPVELMEFEIVEESAGDVKDG